MIGAFVFDLDGTLVETEKPKALYYVRAAAELRPDLNEEENHGAVHAYRPDPGRTSLSAGLRGVPTDTPRPEPESSRDPDHRSLEPWYSPGGAASPKPLYSLPAVGDPKPLYHPSRRHEGSTSTSPLFPLLLYSLKTKPRSCFRDETALLIELSVNRGLQIDNIKGALSLRYALIPT